MREFNTKYFLPLIQEKKENEFIRLHQGTQNIANYETQFTKLVKFVPKLIVIEQKRIRRFIQGLSVKIQKDLAVAQINMFGDAVEKVQLVKNARFQVRTFHTKKRASSSNFGQVNKDVPPKFGRETGGIRHLETPRGAPSRGPQGERGSQRSASQEGSTSASCVYYDYCGKANHTTDNYWRKEKNVCVMEVPNIRSPTA